MNQSSTLQLIMLGPENTIRGVNILLFAIHVQAVHILIHFLNIWLKFILGSILDSAGEGFFVYLDKRPDLRGSYYVTTVPDTKLWHG